MLSVAAAFGPLWLVRLGVVVAIGAAVATTVLAWREVRADRRDHAAAMLAASKAHGESMRIERSHNSAVLQVVTDRNVAAMAEITRQQTIVAQLRGEVSAFKGDRAALTAEITRRESVVSELRAALRSREGELESALAAAVAATEAAAEAAAEVAALAAARGSDDDAEVHTMPRRVLLDNEQPRRANEPEQALGATTVVDLDPNGLDRGPERRVDTRTDCREPVLPNYEEDRKFA